MSVTIPLKESSKMDKRLKLVREDTCNALLVSNICTAAELSCEPASVHVLQSINSLLTCVRVKRAR